MIQATALFSGRLSQANYLAQFVHVGCGGAPRTIPEHRELGAAVSEAGFRSLVKEDA